MLDIFYACKYVLNTPLLFFVDYGTPLITLKSVFSFALISSSFGWFVGRLFR